MGHYSFSFQTVERNIVFLLANFMYGFCLILLTGAYMLPAGDITYEVSILLDYKKISSFSPGGQP